LKHVTVRMAWHDSGWDGTICRDPAAERSSGSIWACSIAGITPASGGAGLPVIAPKGWRTPL
ncbi:MAG: hypothetical protein WCC96_01425, partial [Rhodomicrobium sp.]